MREDVSAFLKKMEGMWPILRNNEEHKEAIVLLLNERASHVGPDDLTAAYRLLVTNARTSNKDGGPAWPPSPQEVLGCVLSAHRERKADVKITIPYYGPRRVAGRVCRRCQSGLTLFENVLYCESCRSAQMVDGRAQLTAHEIHALEFVDPPSVDYDAAEQAKVEALAAVRGLITATKDKKGIK